MLRGDDARDRFEAFFRTLAPTEVARAQWVIENGLHRALDETMNEDRRRNWKDHGPEDIALRRRLALNLAKLENSKRSMNVDLKHAGRNDEFLSRPIAQFAEDHIR